MWNENHKIDKLLRDIAQKHEEPYNPADWNEMQEILGFENMESKLREIAQHEEQFDQRDWTAMQAHLAQIKTPMVLSRLVVIRRNALKLVASLLFIFGLHYTKSPSNNTNIANNTAIALIAESKIQKLPIIETKETIKLLAMKNKIPTEKIAATKLQKIEVQKIETPLKSKDLTILAVENYPKKLDFKANELELLSAIATKDKTENEQNSNINVEQVVPNNPNQAHIESNKTIVFETIPTLKLADINTKNYNIEENITRNLAEKLSLFVANIPTEGLEISNNNPDNKNKKNATSTYQHLELSMAEALHSNISFRIGTQKLYNIFAVGYQFAGEGSRVAFGYGFGKEVKNMGNKTRNLELVCHQISERGNFGARLNLLVQAKFQWNYKLSPRYTYFFGGSLNNLVSNVGNEGLTSAALIPSWAIIQHSFSNNIAVKNWLGFQTGITIKI